MVVRLDKGGSPRGPPRGVRLPRSRHYFATLLIHNGASVKTVQMALGHSSPTITLNTYLDDWPEPADRTRVIVQNALGRRRQTLAVAR